MRMFGKLAATVAVLAMVAAGCASDKGETTQPSGGPAPDEVTIGVRSDIDTFDAHQTLAEYGSAQMLRLSYSSLVLTEGDGSVVPQLAESFEVKDASTMFFQLREGLVCPNGEELTASDIGRSYERLAAAETAAPYASRIFSGGGVTIDADDEARQLTMTLEHPNADAIAGIGSTGQVICPEGLADPEKLATTPNGPSAYDLVSMKRGDTYEYERRDDFVGLPEGTTLEDMPKRIVLRVIADDSAMVNAILTKEITTGIVFGRDGERLEGKDDVTVFEAPGFGGDALVFNHAEGHVGGDVEFRRALSLAVDPDDYNRAASFERGRPLRTIYTPNMQCYAEENASILGEVDMDAAAAALDAAGYVVKGDHRVRPDGSAMKLKVVGHSGQNNGPEYIADVLTKLQIDHTTDQASYDRTINSVFSSDFDLFVWPYTGSLGTPAQMVAEMSGDLTNSINASGIQNEVYERTAKLAKESDSGNCAHWAEGERSMLEDAEAVPLVWPVAYHFANGITFSGGYYAVDPYTIRSAS